MLITLFLKCPLFYSHYFKVYGYISYSSRVVTQLKPQKLKEVRRGKHDYLEEEIFQRLDWKEQGCPRTLGNRMELKELAISKAPENEWRARST